MHTTNLVKTLAGVLLSGVTAVLAQQAQTPAPAYNPNDVKFDTSYVFAHGDYGLSDDTDVSVITANPTLENNRWRLQMTIPYVFLNGPASVIGNAGIAPVSRSERGFGDLTLAGTQKLLGYSEIWSNELTVKVKFPTADETRGLGTGKADTVLQYDAFRRGGMFTPFGNVGYQFLGKSAAYPMKNGFIAGAGVSKELAAGTTAGVGANWRQPIVVGGKSAFETMVFAQHRFSETSHIQAFAMHGFTDASPSLAVGATIGLRY